MRILDVRTGQDVIAETSIVEVKVFACRDGERYRVTLDSGYRMFLTDDDAAALACEFKKKEASNVLL